MGFTPCCLTRTDVSLEALFCSVDDFCQQFEPKWQSELLTTGLKTRKRSQGLCLSEKMTLDLLQKFFNG